MLTKSQLFIILFACVAMSASSQSYVITYAGKSAAGFVDGDTAIARFNKPFGMCMDKSGNIYIADGGNNCIRKINTSTNIVSTYAGTGVAGYLDGSAGTAWFNSPSDLFADDSGNVYVSDFLNHRIRKISFSGYVTTVAGNGTAGYMDGLAANASFNYPRGICMDKDYNLYIGDSWNHRIRKISASGNVTTFAGGGSAIGVGSVGAYKDAMDTSARFYTPSGLSVDKNNNIYVADAYNHRIRKIDTSGSVTTIAGTGATGPGNGGFGDGNVNVALLNTPTELYVDGAGKIYIGDTFSNRVRSLNSGILNTLAGSGVSGFLSGLDTLARFNYPRGVVADVSNNKVYVVDYNNNAIRLITPGVSGVGEEYDFYTGSINIYPNPSSEYIQYVISGEAGDRVTVNLYDAMGREVMSREETIEAAVTEKKIETSRFGGTSGTYLLRITNGNQEKTQKQFVVK